MTDQPDQEPPEPPRRSPWDPPAGRFDEAAQAPVVPQGPVVPQAPVAPQAPPAPVAAEAAEGSSSWGSWTPPPASESIGPYGGPSTGGTGGASGKEPVLGVRGQRYGAPRFAGRGALAVFSILGLLLTLGIMAFLAMKVLDGVSGSSKSDEATTGSVLAELTTTVPGADPAATPTPGATTPGATGATGAANAAACTANARTIQTAAEAYDAINGAYPPDLQTLIDSGLLQPKGPIPFELHVQDGSVVLTGTGTCAGT